MSFSELGHYLRNFWQSTEFGINEKTDSSQNVKKTKLPNIAEKVLTGNEETTSHPFFSASLERTVKRETCDLSQLSPSGFAKVLEAFSSDFQITDQEIADTVLPSELEQLELGNMSYSEFRTRNTLYAFDHMLERELKQVRVAFLKQGFVEMTDVEFEADRETLSITLEDIRTVLADEVCALDYADYITKHSAESIEILDAHSQKLLEEKSQS